MPGLLRGVARTAVVVGVAAAVLTQALRLRTGPGAGQGGQDDPGGRREGAEGPTPEEAAAEPIDDDVAHKVDRLKQLGDLRDQGVLSDAEFAEQKARLLTSWP